MKKKLILLIALVQLFTFIQNVYCFDHRVNSLKRTNYLAFLSEDCESDQSLFVHSSGIFKKWFVCVRGNEKKVIMKLKGSSYDIVTRIILTAGNTNTTHLLPLESVYVVNKIFIENKMNPNSKHHHKEYYLQFPYVEQMNILKFLDLIKDSNEKRKTIYQIIYDVLIAIIQMKERKTSHNDIAVKNIGFNGNHFILYDFDMSALISPLDDPLGKWFDRGTPIYYPPEWHFKHSPENKDQVKKDIWSLGIMVLRLFTQNEEWFSFHSIAALSEYLASIKGNYIDHILNTGDKLSEFDYEKYKSDILNLNDLERDFLRLALTVNVKDRVDPEKLLEHKLLDEVRRYKTENDYIKERVNFPESFYGLYGLVPEDHFDIPSFDFFENGEIVKQESEDKIRIPLGSSIDVISNYF